MQGKFIHRKLQSEAISCLADFPAVSILGPRQCGKSTLAREMISQSDDMVYLDLELPSDIQKLSEPELFFRQHRGKLICLDEIQRIPEIFPVLRSLIDEERTNGQFLILGSASPELIRQSSETLAGRIAYLELTPFLLDEINSSGPENALTTYWLRGGFPDSYLARTAAVCKRWRENFMLTFLERDVPQFGFSIPAATLRRVWQLCANSCGQVFNASRLGSNIGVSHTTMKKYIDILSNTFMLRILQPFTPNLSKRLTKSPKIYLRDTGILHSLLGIDSFDDLLAHPVLGASWETLVIENIIAAMPGWEPFFYRTAAGAEIDLLLVRGRRKFAIECKSSAAPKISRGFWSSIEELGVEKAWIIAPVKDSYPIADNVIVSPLSDFKEWP